MPLSESYKNVVVPKLMSELGIKNVMMVPRLVKIVVNSTTKEAVTNSKVLDTLVQDLTAITGQRPIITRAKKSIATYKLREGMPLGVAVTLRRRLMFEFFNRLINVALPRTRDFKGLDKTGFDGRGNYTLGIREHIIFPEVNYDKVDHVRGLNVTIVTSATNDTHGRALLTAMGCPFHT